MNGWAGFNPQLGMKANRSACGGGESGEMQAMSTGGFRRIPEA